MIFLLSVADIYYIYNNILTIFLSEFPVDKLQFVNISQAALSAQEVEVVSKKLLANSTSFNNSGLVTLKTCNK